MNRRILLFRYDVESTDAEKMRGFLRQMVSVHRRDHLPVTLFCTGGALDARVQEFQAFRDETGDDPLFDVGDHSYSHVGVGYTAGRPVAELRADYERSLDTHERILGRRPDSLSLCGTGTDGARLDGFDALEKARAEFDMLVALGFRRVNTFLTESDNSRDFIDYRRFDRPDVKGFPSAFSDTAWIMRADAAGDFLAPLREEIDRRAEENAPMPVICHDWVTWNHGPDRDFTHIRRLAEYAQERGFALSTIKDAVAAFAPNP